jgi:ATP-dependent helicase/nuclease subunit A
LETWKVCDRFTACKVCRSTAEAVHLGVLTKHTLTTPQTLNIEILSAGAGSGKTYTLTGRMVSLLQQGIRPAGIMATTFTQKAAAELQDRVRVRLLEAGMRDAANELGQALIGTVHGIGVRLLQRFAFEAGVSPLVEIIAEGDSRRLFNEPDQKSLR